MYIYIYIILLFRPAGTGRPGPRAPRVETAGAGAPTLAGRGRIFAVSLLPTCFSYHLSSCSCRVTCALPCATCSSSLRRAVLLRAWAPVRR